MGTNNDNSINQIEQDKLEISNSVDGLTKFITECETPLTLAIQGRWGAGKTSIMQLVQSRLKKNNVLTVYFNTWQYSQLNDNLYENFIYYLLQQFGLNFVEMEKNDPNLGTIIKTLLRVVSRHSQFVETIKEDIDDIYGLFKSKTEKLDEISNCKKYFERLVDYKIKKTNNSRLVIFIDDLDRLEPKKVLELLEVIKLFLDVDKCVFVLAIDYEVIIEGVRNKYGIEFSEQKGREYFDKIIQVPFNIPSMQYKIDKIVEDGLGEQFKNSDRMKDIVDMTSICTDNNPRTIKRIINAYVLINMIIGSKNTKSDYQFFLYLIQCIQYTYYDVYSFIMKKMKYYDEIDDKKDLSELWLKEYETEDKTEKEIQVIQNLFEHIFTEKDVLHEEFILAMSYAAEQTNDLNIRSHVARIELICKDNEQVIRRDVNSTTEAFKDSVVFILNNRKSKEKIPTKFAKWLSAEKANENYVKGYYKKYYSFNVDGDYTLGIFSNDYSKKTQTEKLWKEYNTDKNLSIKWLDENNVEILSLM